MIPGNEAITPPKSKFPFLSPIWGLLNKLLSGNKHPATIPPSKTKPIGINFEKAKYPDSLPAILLFK